MQIGPLPQAVRGLFEATDLPSSDLVDEQIKRLFYCGTPDAPLALVGLEIYGGFALLRSLLVSLDARSLGHGPALVKRAVKHVLESGVHRAAPRAAGHPVNTRICEPMPCEFRIHAQTALGKKVAYEKTPCACQRKRPIDLDSLLS
jgi:GNAT superfamily N-acetyltransferase